MMIYGPYITVPVVIPEHTEHHLDPGAYWNLDFDGTELPEGAPPTLLYARVAYPTLRAAMAEFDTQQAAQRERQRHKPRPRPVRGRVTVRHTGIEAHDGYAPHSHEVRPDHLGVPREELADETPGPVT